VEGSVIAGRYSLERILGRGAMGEVWLAHDAHEGRAVAVKLIEPTIADNDEVKRRFVRAAQSVARASGPHVAQIFDHGVTEDGRPYMVMEYLVGTSLRDRLTQEGVIPLGETAELLTGLCAALGPAHDAGLVHRDLKPENIFLVQERGRERVKLLDFGVAKSTRRVEERFASTATGDLIGTPHYMSPEQAQGLKTVDHRTDLWSLGVIVFECLTGVRPFEAKALARLVARILAGPIPVPSRLAPEAPIPPEVDAWMARALARDRAARFASAGELAASFDRAVAGEAPPARPDESSQLPLSARIVAES
jgi:serine/threonine-protein kinase